MPRIVGVLSTIRMETTLRKRNLATLASAAPCSSRKQASLTLASQVDRAQRDRNPAPLSDSLHVHASATAAGAKTTPITAPGHNERSWQVGQNSWARPRAKMPQPRKSCSSSVTKLGRVRPSERRADKCHFSRRMSTGCVVAAPSGEITSPGPPGRGKTSEISAGSTSDRAVPRLAPVQPPRSR